MKQISILACLVLVAACGAGEARLPEPGVEEAVAPKTAQKDPVTDDMLLGDEGDYVDYVEPEPLSDVCSAALDNAVADMSVLTFNEFDMPLINGERADEEGYWRMWCEISPSWMTLQSGLAAIFPAMYIGSLIFKRGPGRQ